MWIPNLRRFFNCEEMSRAHDGHRSFFPVGNPFRMILPGGSHLSPKLTELLTSYEDGLASSLRKLKPEATSEVLTLSWMKLAVDCLSEMHTNIATLITELELPLSDWDEKWVDIYLNSSVKLLDICIALSSELSRLDQGQLLMQYALHVLDSGSDMPSQEQLKRAELSLKEWIEKVSERSLRLDSCLAALQELSGNVCLMKVKHSAKGKVLMRALYGIEAVTALICNVLVAVLSGSFKPLVEFDVPEKFGWSKAFIDLRQAISGELSKQLSRGSVAAVKELEEVEVCARQLHALTSAAQLSQLEVENASLAHAQGHLKEVVVTDTTAQEGAIEDNLKIVEDTSHQPEVIMLQSITTEEVLKTADSKEDAKNNGHTKEVMVLEKTSEGNKDDNIKQVTGIDREVNCFERREELLNCISSMSKSTEGLRLGLDSLSKRVGDFFHIVLTGRDALLCNLRLSDGGKVAAEVRS